MLKKIRRIVALVLTFVMMSSMTVLAAESNQKLSVQPEDMTEQSETLETRAAAPAVSSVKIESAYIDSNTNHVIVVVYIVGYGNREIAKYDGNTVSMIEEDLITGADRVVYAFRQYYDCGVAVAGNHSFTFQTTSINPPRNTVYASETIIVQ